MKAKFIKDQLNEIQFSDGMKFDTSGPLRKTERSDGWYVVGKGFLIPVKDEHEANQVIQSMTKGASLDKD